jgi:hypothetical protein
MNHIDPHFRDVVQVPLSQFSDGSGSNKRTADSGRILLHKISL